MKKKLKEDALACRRNKVGGEAVLEGVMMKAGNRCCTALRMPDKSIRVVERPFFSARQKHRGLGIPLVRGVVGFIESLLLSYRTLSLSAEALGVDEAEQETRFEKWLSRTFGKSIYDVIMVVASLFSIVLAFGLFFFLPILAARGLEMWLGEMVGIVKSLVEGVLRIAIFIAYISLVSLMPDIRRTFQYHGAEHKSIFCYESGAELTVENVRRQCRFHPRCGTSLIFVIMLISIILFSFVPFQNVYLRLLLKIPLLPIIIALGFEFLMYSGKHDNIITKIATAPGLWMQRLTTKEPDDDQIEIAITALKRALCDEFPDVYLSPVEGQEDTFTVLTGEAAEAAAAEAAAAEKAAAEAAAHAENAEGDTPEVSGHMTVVIPPRES